MHVYVYRAFTALLPACTVHVFSVFSSIFRIVGQKKKRQGQSMHGRRLVCFFRTDFLFLLHFLSGILTLFSPWRFVSFPAICILEVYMTFCLVFLWHISVFSWCGLARKSHSSYPPSQSTQGLGRTECLSDDGEVALFDEVGAPRHR